MQVVPLDYTGLKEAANRGVSPSPKELGGGPIR